MAESDVRALYYKLYEYYLTKNPSLKTYHGILADCYQSEPESFKTFNKAELLRIKKIQEDIRDNKWSLFSSPLDLCGEAPSCIRGEKSSKNHKDLCWQIAKNSKDTLEPFTGPINYMNFEHPTGYGPADLAVFGQNRICYIIEVKSTTADHAIVGQVLKYFIGMSVRLGLRIYDDVRMICMCPGYDKPAFNGLKSIGAQLCILKSDPISVSAL